MFGQILDGTRAGLALPETQRNELMSLKKELSQACLEFSVSTSSCSITMSSLFAIEKLQ